MIASLTCAIVHKFYQYSVTATTTTTKTITIILKIIHWLMFYTGGGVEQHC